MAHWTDCRIPHHPAHPPDRRGCYAPHSGAGGRAGGGAGYPGKGAVDCGASTDGERFSSGALAVGIQGLRPA
eukprot:6261543-Alexandrium_andersonii.AAC.1